MRNFLLNSIVMNTINAIRDGDTYYLSAEAAQLLEKLLSIFSVLMIVGVFLLVLTVTVCIINIYKSKNCEKEVQQ